MSTIVPDWLWVVFVGIVVLALIVDFVVLRKQGAHDVTVEVGDEQPLIVEVAVEQHEIAQTRGRHGVLRRRLRPCRRERAKITAPVSTRSSL